MIETRGLCGLSIFFLPRLRNPPCVDLLKSDSSRIRAVQTNVQYMKITPIKQ